MIIPKFIRKANVERKVKVVLPLLKDAEKILDFGCGDLTFARALKDGNNSLKITGVDIVDFNNRYKDINFVKYNGSRLPFKSGTFDSVICFYVLHHCDDAKKYFKECARVAKKRVLLVEAVARSKNELPFMRFMDWFYNFWKSSKIPLTYQFLTLSEWRNTFKRCKVKKVNERDITIMPEPKFLPIGKAVIFEVFL